MTDLQQPPKAREIPNEPDADLPPLHAYPDEVIAATNGHTKPQVPADPEPTAAPPPHDIDAEKALLGAAMLGAADILTSVPPEAFYAPGHGHIAQAIITVADERGRGDAVLVASWLDRHGLLDQAGGPGLLAEAMATSLGATQAPRYAEIVIAHWRARRLITAARELESTVRNHGPEAGTALLAPLLESATTTNDVDRLRDGTWLLDAPSTPDAVWGANSEVLWARGEPCLVTGPPGVGKTTLVGQIVRARLGLADQVLGWPVEPEHGRILYLASDRSEQIRRALARHFTPDDRDHLREHLKIWPGPPPADLAKDTSVLTRLAHQAGATTVILDSLKDMAIGLSDDEVGAGLNQAMQLALTDGIEVLALHHQRKGNDGKRPKTLEDLYGSTWIAAGAGSILLLWGAAGDLVVELHHLKQPSSDIGPLQIEHDHDAGTTRIHKGFDLHTALRNAPQGLTTLEVCRLWLEKDKPTENERRKAQRRLDNLVRIGHAHRIVASGRDPGGHALPDRYFAVDKHAQEDF